MSDPRLASIKLIKFLPEKTGRNTRKMVIELYPAWQWSSKAISPRCRGKCRVIDQIGTPCQISLSSDLDGLFRLRINGKWYSSHGFCYEFYKESAAYKLLQGECK